MSDIVDALVAAAALLVTLDPTLIEIVARSFAVSGSATVLATLLGLPIGGALAVVSFPGRAAVTALLNAGMGLPPVVVGLVIYLMLSRSGPLGSLGLLFTPTAMIAAQTLLILPIVAAISRQMVADLLEEYGELLASLGVTGVRAVPTLLWEGRHRLLTAILAGFGRAIAEVGAVLIVGGNIAHVTRVMTTTIALETSRGNLSLALALGLILVALAFAVSALLSVLQGAARRVEA